MDAQKPVTRQKLMGHNILQSDNVWKRARNSNSASLWRFWQINSSPTISIRLHKGRWIHPVHLDIFVIGWSYYKHHEKAHWLRWLLCFCCCFLAAVPNLYSAVIQVKQRVACRVQVSTKNVFFKIPPSDWKLICVFNFYTTLCARQFSFLQQQQQQWGLFVLTFHNNKKVLKTS